METHMPTVLRMAWMARRMVVEEEAGQPLHLTLMVPVKRDHLLGRDLRPGQHLHHL